MAARVCACGCGRSLDGRRADAKFFSSSCRSKTALRRSHVPPASATQVPPSTDVADALATELAELEMATSYEGCVALGIARQLDNGAVQGAAYSSLSKELDRRVDALRLKAERKDDPAKVVKGRLEEKRAAMSA